MLFFPSHDIALANGVRHFNPPAAALRLQEDLAWLSDVWNTDPAKVIPWGWDWDTRNYIHHQYHIALQDLPSDAQLEALRQLSNRRMVIGLLQDLHYEGAIPQYLTSLADVEAFIGEHERNRTKFVLKTPWSSSGRGLILSSTPRHLMLQRASSTIRKMGGIMGEDWLEKIQDFAMLFYVGQQEVHFIGYSLFDNEECGTYRQGYLLSNAAIQKRLEKLCDFPQGSASSVAETVGFKGDCQNSENTKQGYPDASGHMKTQTSTSNFEDLQASLIPILNRLFSPFFGQPWEVGYIGIDMMITSTGLMPCVEMNVRCTMGVVARLYFDRHMQPHESGRFLITPLLENGHFEAKFEKNA
ncbi:MAG: hypothetical protein IJP70_07965 [Bacteroidales bacterium]|nr:hypothetical protein [Bacteroidales bacterium]